MGTEVSQIACGKKHTLALVPSRGRLYSFGLGGCGQLGNNSFTRLVNICLQIKKRLISATVSDRKSNG